MVPNFRMPLSTNGSFPQNETGSPIATCLYLWTHFNQLLTEIKLLFVSMPVQNRIFTTEALRTQRSFCLSADCNPPNMFFRIENALSQGYQILVEHILGTGRYLQFDGILAFQMSTSNGPTSSIVLGCHLGWSSLSKRRARTPSKKSGCFEIKCAASVSA